MSWLIEVGLQPGVPDAAGRSVERKIQTHLGIPVERVEVRRLYRIGGGDAGRHDAGIGEAEARFAAEELFHDPVIQRYSLNESLEAEPFAYSLVVCYRPGVTDNEGRTAASALADLLERAPGSALPVSTATQYLLHGVSASQAHRVGRELLANDLIENVEIQSYEQWRKSGTRLPGEGAAQASVPASLPAPPAAASIEEIDLEVEESRLLEISRERVLALNLEEMKAIRDYFRREEVREARARVGLGPQPTDVELEALAQTWSEHCHHKVFNGSIEYRGPDGPPRRIRSLFASYIRRVTEEIDSPWLMSVFRDNAGVIRFNDRLALVYKVETHNSPSALDPYGGAMTGIVGVNRDPFGTGRGARLVANVWGYCLGDPFTEAELPQGLLHPRRIRDGVHRGVIEGGNQSGIPYARGWELFDDRFMGKPLVFCGTLGEMPLEIGGRPSTEKRIESGDAVVMVGGRVGKDGIHGATFSSEELHSGSPVQAVQIGDPITQKRMTDMLLEARDRLLYRTLTDNGAGGLSSSVGEMALLSGGCEIDLARVPLKYPGLLPWEILVSEAQERMSLAVPPESLPAYLELSARRGVESTELGRFTASGYFHARYGARSVAYLELEFLHHGDPSYHLEATFSPRTFEEPEVRLGSPGGGARPGGGPGSPGGGLGSHDELLQAMVRRLNLASCETKARQYDHEVQGRSIVKPFGGRCFDVPTDATVLRAEYEGFEGIVLTEGVNPYYSDLDTYWMAASVVDLAVRRVVSAGGDPGFIAALDNFCWPNVVKEGMPERSHKLAQLVRACEGLYDHCLAYRVPLISGKDSMSNDSTLTDPPISVPPTLLVSVIGRIEDLRRAVTLDVKAPGDLLYILGETREELGASELYRCYGELTRGRAYVGGQVPRVDAPRAMDLYRKLHQAIGEGLVRSCHTPALGGLALALVRACFAGELGAEVDLVRVPGSAASDLSLLYSESNSRFLVSVAAGLAREFEARLEGQPLACIGEVRDDPVLRIRGQGGELLIEQPLSALKAAWKEVLSDL
ncbi:MAG: hypothetical protein JW820_16120 [Spirochaetales bacterium]|nr:hypothetical protein [Spirochaetales bacterium]